MESVFLSGMACAVADFLCLLSDNQKWNERAEADQEEVLYGICGIVRFGGRAVDGRVCGVGVQGAGNEEMQPEKCDAVRRVVWRVSGADAVYRLSARLSF